MWCFSLLVGRRQVARLDDSLAYATGEEALQRAVDTADELTKQLRRLEGLPLVVTQVLPA